MGGKHSRNKGHNFEREIAREMREIGYPKAKRHLEYQSQEAELGQDLDGTKPYSIQCKRLKNYVPMNKIFEVKDTGENIPVLISKADNEPALAVIKWEDLKCLIASKNLAPTTRDEGNQ